MKHAISLLLLVCAIFITPLFAQEIPQTVIEQVDSSFYDHMSGVYPHHMCHNNNSLYFYRGNINIHKVGKMQVPLGQRRFEERFMLWMRIDADYENPFTSGKARVQAIAQVRETFNGDWEIVQLLWKKDDCMKYKVLLDIEAQPELPKIAHTDSITDLSAKKEAPNPEKPLAFNAMPKPSLRIVGNLKKGGRRRKRKASIQGYIICQNGSQKITEVTVQARFLSSSQKLLLTEEYVIHEIDPDKEEIAFNLEVEPPKGTEAVLLDILDSQEEK